jgi:hypothetical protein
MYHSTPHAFVAKDGQGEAEGTAGAGPKQRSGGGGAATERTVPPLRHASSTSRPLDTFITNIFEHCYEHPWVHQLELRWRLSTLFIRGGLGLAGSSWGFNSCRAEHAGVFLVPFAGKLGSSTLIFRSISKRAVFRGEYPWAVALTFQGDAKNAGALRARHR